MQEKYHFTINRLPKEISERKTIVFDDEIAVAADDTIETIIEKLEIEILPDEELRLINCNDENSYLILLDFYYYNGVVYSNFNVKNVIIDEFDKYGYNFNHHFQINLDPNGGIGSVQDIFETYQMLSQMANEWVSEHHIEIWVASVLGKYIYSKNEEAIDEKINAAKKKIKKVINKLSKTINKNIPRFQTFKNSATFQKSFNVDTFTKAYRLENIRNNLEEIEYIYIIDCILSRFGFKFDPKKKEWTRK